MENDRTSIELVKEKTDIVSVISRYVKLTQAGKNMKGLCPFHNEKTPSFNVNSDLGMYKCFGCGKYGDVIKFIEEIENLDFGQALEKLAKEAGVNLEVKNKNISPAIQLNSWACTYFQKELYSPNNKYALDYVLKRGITKEQIEKFQIGYATGNGEFLRRLNGYKKYPKTTLLDSGLFIEKNGIIKEKFIKRVMFPVHNLGGRIIAFTGRKLPNNELGPKYLNTPETSVYQKRNNLYGMYQAKASLKKEDLCIVLEGQTDVVSLSKAGFTNAVAPLGTALTQNQLELIKRYTNNILFIFDNDIAGQTALERAFILASSLEMDTYAVNTDEFKDVDELIQADVERFKELVKSRKDTFSYLLTHFIDKVDITELKSIKQIERYVKSLIDAVTNETSRNFYIEKAKSLVPQLNFDSYEVKSKGSSEQTIQSQNIIMNLEDLFIKAQLNNLSERYYTGLPSTIFKNRCNKAIIKVLQEIDNINLTTFREALKEDIETLRHFDNLIFIEKDVNDVELLKKRLLKEYYENRLNSLRIILASAEEKEDTVQIKKILDKVIEYTDKLKSIKNENNKL